MIDRFSDLPDEVAGLILNFLGESLRDLIRLGAVSNKCRQLHLSAPSLTISSKNISFSSRLRARLLNHWDRYFFHRGDNKIEKFTIDWSFGDRDRASSGDEFFRIGTLIQNAVRCNVGCLQFFFTPNILNTVVFPSCIYHCHSLTHLCMSLSGGVIQTPSLSFSSYLLFLKLHETKVEDNRFFEWVSNACKCIKEIHLFNVGGMKSITIESSSLETFGCLLFSDTSELRDIKISGEKLEDVCIHWEFHYKDSPVLDCASSSRSLNIFAPKLKTLTWCGNFLNHQHLGNLMCLEYARMFLFGGLMKCSNLFEVLCSLCMAFLVEGSTPLPLCNIHDLTLEVNNLDHDYIQAMVYIFRGITTLNTLCIMSHLLRREVTYDESEDENNVTGTYNSDTYEEDDATEVEDNDSDRNNCENSEEDDATEEEDNEFSRTETDTDNSETTEEDDAYAEENNAPMFDAEFWKLQNLSFTNELQDVILEIVEGNDYTMELARYILENAKNLKKMVIRHPPQHPNVVQMVSKIKIISSATVILKERRLCPLRWQL